MKTTIFYVAMAATVALATLSGCNSNKKKAAEQAGEQAIPEVVDTHNSRNSLDYEGTYTGTLPCADCDGIVTEITLKGDDFTMKLTYQGKEEGNNTFERSGKYIWDDAGRAITLDGDKHEQYQVGENILFKLDEDGKRITGDLAANYELRKQ